MTASTGSAPRAALLKHRLRPAKHALERTRACVFEQVGSDRFSRPALYDIERKLQPHLPTTGGFFIEAGANDGFAQSNTYWLERFRGWQGLLLEPVPELAIRCARFRPRSRVINAALVADDYEGEHATIRSARLTSLVKGSWSSPAAERAHLARGTPIAATYESPCRLEP